MFSSRSWHRGSASVLSILLASFILLPALQKMTNPASFEKQFKQKTNRDAYDPLAKAQADGLKVVNHEATVPVQCYTKTEGVANPCWTCHADPQQPNEWVDWDLQEEYAFSDFALTNRWLNLFKDRSQIVKNISDSEVLSYIREDNYTPLKEHLQKRSDYPGYKPDLDFVLGFDEEGFARDGSGWRAFRYKPFPGTFWPTNGNTDDVMVRLPKIFQTHQGTYNKAIYKINLSLLEAAIASPPVSKGRPRANYPVEPLDETLVNFDLNGDGHIMGKASKIAQLPKHYLGDAQKIPLKPYVYPQDTEFLHSVRYVDPDKPGETATRMKELRYAKKVVYLDSWAMSYVYEREYNEKEEGSLPHYAGSPSVGFRNQYGWQLQGFIEDAQGRLRLQNAEEHQFCMGCHGSLGITVDHTFALARKVPGAKGWAYQNLNGIQDVPQVGHERGEVETFFKRVGGGDEFRANQEILARFFDNHKLNEAKVRQAAKGGNKDILHLVLPSRERSLQLNKAYMALVREQSFEKGRDVIIDPIDNVHKTITNGTTDLGKTNRVFKDGRIWLEWNAKKTGSK